LYCNLFKTFGTGGGSNSVAQFHGSVKKFKNKAFHSVNLYSALLKSLYTYIVFSCERSIMTTQAVF